MKKLLTLAQNSANINNSLKEIERTHMPTQTARNVVMAAYQYLADITPPTQKISDVRIEAVEPYKEDKIDYWKVILSYDNIGQFPFDNKREYKEFKIADSDAHVIKMQSASGAA